MLGLFTAVPFSYRALALVALAIAIFGYGWVKGAAHGEARLNAYILKETQLSQAELNKRLEKEKVLKLSQEKIFNALIKAKAISNSVAVATDNKLRDFQTAADRAASSDSCPTGGTVSPFAAIAGECSAALAALDGHDKGLEITASGLQSYTREVCLSK